MPEVTVKEVKDLINNLGESWDKYKKANDERLAEIEKSGKATGETIQKVEKIEKDLAEFASAKERLDKLETAFKRRKPSKGEEELTDEQLEQKHAFMAYLRKGEQRMKPEESKALSVGSDPDGGYRVTPDMSGRLIQRIFDTSPLRAVANVQTISTDALEGIVDDNEADAGWTSEQATRSETNTPEIGKWRIPVHEMYAKPKATQQFLEDASVNVEQWLLGKLQRRFMRLENTAFVVGTGVGKPRGFNDYDDAAAVGTYERDKIGTRTTAGNDAITFDDIINLFYDLKQEYRVNAVWAANRSTYGYIRKLKDSQNRYLWEPSLQVGQPATILGRPTIEFNDMPDVADDTLPLVIADWMEFYQIVDRVGFAVLRDPFSAKPYVEFYTRRRVGGGVINFDAGKRLRVQ